MAIDASDVLVGNRSVGELASGAVNSGPASLTIPAQTVAGIYYIVATADGESTVPETNETNNTRPGVIRITIGN
jgi:subtilase family serine protease